MLSRGVSWGLEAARIGTSEGRVFIPNSFGGPHIDVSWAWIQKLVSCEKEMQSQKISKADMRSCNG